MKSQLVHFFQLLGLSVGVTLFGPGKCAVAEDAQFPVLDCTVECAYGFFDAYSAPPSQSDTCTLNLQQLQREVPNGTIQFERKQKRTGPDYVCVVTPLAVEHQEGKTNFAEFSARLVTSENANKVQQRSRLDITRNRKLWTIYYTYEVGGVTTGVVVMTGKARKLSSS